ncbi:MAG: hypothetical protein PVG66_10850 [Chromatiales bacterium]
MPAAMALGQLKLSVEQIRQAQKQVEQLNLHWQKDSASRRLHLAANKIVLSDDQRSHVSGFQLDCSNLQLQQELLGCPTAQLTFSNPLLDARQAQASLQWRKQGQQLDLTISELGIAAGHAVLDFAWQQAEWRASLELQQAQLDKLAEISGFLPSGSNLQGEFSTQLSASGRQQRLQQADYHVQGSNIAFSSSDGRYLSDAIGLTAQGQLSQSSPDGALQGKLQLKVDRGEVLTPQIYNNFKQSPLSLQVTDASYQPDHQQWHIDRALIEQPLYQLDIQQLSGLGAAVASGRINLPDVPLKAFFEQNLHPLLTQDLAQVELDGRLSAQLAIQNGRLGDYEISLQQADIRHLGANQTSKYAFHGLNAKLLHNTQHPEDLSEVQFESAQLFDTIRFGETHLPLETANDSISLQGGTSIPLFDGSIIVETFRFDWSTTAPQVEFQGVLTPVSLPLLTQALDWPEMQGKISGLIPSVSYSDGNARLDGTLLVRAFDGDILLQNVAASHLLSSWPVMQADVEIRQLDLEQLTRTFSFGRITGLLDGQVHDLQLENWQPVAFDAKFHSSDAPGKRRISQKAVDNISNLGGSGVAGAMSRTFMRFFEDFGYSELGISCKLENGICIMDGVGSAGDGFYLVRGGGIPRIDVIGYNHATDWNQLVDRLVNISQSGAPTVQ